MKNSSEYHDDATDLTHLDRPGFFHKLYRTGCVTTVIFNTCFAALSIVTLTGIVFITKPKQVMHELPPWAWLPLLIVMAPAQVYSQVLSWSTIRAGETATPPAIAARQVRIPSLLRPIVAAVWLVNFCLGVGIVVSLSKPVPGVPREAGEIPLIAVLSFWLTFAANVCLLLAVKTISDDPKVLRFVGRCRLVIDIAITGLAIVYYM